MKNNPSTKIHFTTKRQKNDKRFDIRTGFKFDWNVKSINGKKLTKTVDLIFEVQLILKNNFEDQPPLLGGGNMLMDAVVTAPEEPEERMDDEYEYEADEEEPKNKFPDLCSKINCEEFAKVKNLNLPNQLKLFP